MKEPAVSRTTRKGASYAQALEAAQSVIGAVISYRDTGIRDAAWLHFTAIYAETWLAKHKKGAPPLPLVRTWARQACKRAKYESTHGDDSLEDELISDARLLASNPEGLVISREDTTPILHLLSREGILERAGVPTADANEWRADIGLLLGDDIVGDSPQPYTSPVQPTSTGRRRKADTYKNRACRKYQASRITSWDGLQPARLDKLLKVCYAISESVAQLGQKGRITWGTHGA